MKRLLIIPLLCSLFLPSCDTKLKETYTITIQATEPEHFTPSKQSLEFAKDDFSPIILSYTTEQNYTVANAKASDETAECNIDFHQHQIKITPHNNADFTVQVRLLCLTEQSIIRVESKSEQLHLEKDYLIFRSDDKTVKSINYTLNEGCLITDVEEKDAKADCYNDDLSSKLLIKPIETGELFVEVSVAEHCKLITFDSNGGSLPDTAKKQFLIPYGAEWQSYVDLSKQYATNNKYRFKGWSFTSELGADIIDSDYIVNEDTPSTVYAVYEHDVQFVSNTLKMERIEYDESHIYIYIRQKNTDKYFFPENKDAFTVTDSSESSIDIGYFSPSSPSELAYITIDSTTEAQDGFIKIVGEGYQPIYEVDASTISSTEDHLSYVTTAQAKRGDNFVFNLEAVNDPQTTNDAHYYYVPRRPEEINISIEVDGTYQRLSPEAYQIHFKSEDIYYQKATVVVLGQYVKGNLKIDATAAIADGFYYEIDCYGVLIEYEDDWTSGYHASSDDPEEYLITGQTVSQVTKDNVAIKTVDNDGTSAWYMYNDFVAAYSEDAVKFTTGTTGKVFIGSFAGTNISSVFVHIFEPSYSVFHNASWAQIGQICSSPEIILHRMLTIGETRSMTMDGNEYTLRIADMHHDTIDGSSETAPLTIEFVELLTNNDYGHTIHADDYGHKTVAGTPTSDYRGEEYDSYLSSLPLPADLAPLLKTVSKPYFYTYSDDKLHIARKIFPFSVVELNTSFDDCYKWDEGYPYKYYELHPEDRKKKFVNGTYSNYWTRSHDQATPVQVYAVYINSNGATDKDFSYHDLGYMAAFCI